MPLFQQVNNTRMVQNDSVKIFRQPTTMIIYCRKTGCMSLKAAPFPPFSYNYTGLLQRDFSQCTTQPLAGGLIKLTGHQLYSPYRVQCTYTSVEQAALEGFSSLFPVSRYLMRVKGSTPG